MKKKICLLLSLLLLLGNLTIAYSGKSEEVAFAADMDAQTRNLKKLARVWGFTKYTHMAFLTGEKCWDEELLNLIPVIRYAAEEDVNGILYEWFIGLGDDGFDHLGSYLVFLYTEDFDGLISYFSMPPHLIVPLFGVLNMLASRLNSLDWLSLVSGEVNFGIDLAYYAWVDSTFLSELKKKTDGYDELFGLFTMRIVDVGDLETLPMTDMSWLTDEEYLGEPLATAFSRFHEIPIIDRSNSAAYISPQRFFANESFHPGMDFADSGYRLLGLFRLWNAMEYYFPYRDILDRCWNELLLEFIPKMLEGTDRLSYELTLAALASNLHDAHIRFQRRGQLRPDMFLNEHLGRYALPIWLVEAEGQFVVLRLSSKT